MSKELKIKITKQLVSQIESVLPSIEDIEAELQGGRGYGK